MKKIAALVAALLLVATTAYAVVVGYSRSGWGSPTCGAPIHTAAWTSPATYISEWDESFNTSSFLSVVSDTLTLTQSSTDASENVILRDTSTTLAGNEFTVYFEFKISSVTGLKSNSYQDIFETRSNAIKQLSLQLVSDTSGNITGMRLFDTTDTAQRSVSYSFAADTWYDFYISIKYSSGANDGYTTVKYRPHGTTAWIDGPYFTGRAYGASTTMDYIGVGMFTRSFWANGTLTSNYDNWSLRGEICDSSVY